MKLEIEGVRAGYGYLDSIRNVTFSVEEGAMMTLLGHNGAGKSTLLKAVIGLLPLRDGRVSFGGTPIGQLSTTERIERGMRLLPEGRGIFPTLTVSENIDVVERAAAADKDILFRGQEIYNYFPILHQKRNQVAGQLSGGQQQMLAVGLSLLGRPRCLLLDEPSIGLAPKVVEDIFTRVREICLEQRISVLLVEQNVNAALTVADGVVILNNGEVVFSGTAESAKGSDFWKFF